MMKSDLAVERERERGREASEIIDKSPLYSNPLLLPSKSPLPLLSHFPSLSFPLSHLIFYQYFFSFSLLLFSHPIFYQYFINVQDIISIINLISPLPLFPPKYPLPFPFLPPLPL